MSSAPRKGFSRLSRYPADVRKSHEPRDSHAKLEAPPLPTKGVYVRRIALAAAAVLLSVGLLSPTQALAIDHVNTEKLRNAVTVARHPAA